MKPGAQDPKPEPDVKPPPPTPRRDPGDLPNRQPVNPPEEAPVRHVEPPVPDPGAPNQPEADQARSSGPAVPRS